jgi:hypothetical protein
LGCSFLICKILLSGLLHLSLPLLLCLDLADALLESELEECHLTLLC